MIRNVHNTLMALSSTGLLLVVALMAAAPAPGNAVPGLVASSDAGDRAPLTLAGTPGPVLVAAAQRGDANEAADLPRQGSRGVRRPDIRSAIALPYFSFAQGLRRGNGG